MSYVVSNWSWMNRSGKDALTHQEERLLTRAREDQRLKSILKEVSHNPRVARSHFSSPYLLVLIDMQCLVTHVCSTIEGPNTTLTNLLNLITTLAKKNGIDTKNIRVKPLYRKSREEQQHRTQKYGDMYTDTLPFINLEESPLFAQPRWLIEKGLEYYGDYITDPHNWRTPVIYHVEKWRDFAALYDHEQCDQSVATCFINHLSTTMETPPSQMLLLSGDTSLCDTLSARGVSTLDSGERPVGKIDRLRPLGYERIVVFINAVNLIHCDLSRIYEKILLRSDAIHLIADIQEKFKSSDLEFFIYTDAGTQILFPELLMKSVTALRNQHIIGRHVRCTPIKGIKDFYSVLQPLFSKIEEDKTHCIHLGMTTYDNLPIEYIDRLPHSILLPRTDNTRDTQKIISNLLKQLAFGDCDSTLGSSFGSMRTSSPAKKVCFNTRSTAQSRHSHARAYFITQTKRPATLFKATHAAWCTDDLVEDSAPLTTKALEYRKPHDPRAQNGRKTTFHLPPSLWRSWEAEDAIGFNSYRGQLRSLTYAEPWTENPGPTDPKAPPVTTHAQEEDDDIRPSKR